MRKDVLKVLMYHKVVADRKHCDALSVTTDQLRSHFEFLNQAGCNTILLSDLVAYIDEKKQLPENPVLVTFDDGYADNFHNMLPIAKEACIKTNIFIVPEFIRNNDRAFMSAEELRTCDSNEIQFGLHSYAHASYKNLSEAEVITDLEKCFRWCANEEIPVQPCLAYPYGSFPKETDERKATFFNALEDAGIRAAFRIGNRLNELPLENNLLIQRLDIRGNHLMTDFIMKLQHGRVSVLRKWIKSFSHEPIRALHESFEKVSLVLKESVVKAQAHL